MTYVCQYGLEDPTTTKKKKTTSQSLKKYVGIFTSPDTYIQIGNGHLDEMTQKVVKIQVPFGRQFSLSSRLFGKIMAATCYKLDPINLYVKDIFFFLPQSFVLCPLIYNITSIIKVDNINKFSKYIFFFITY